MTTSSVLYYDECTKNLYYDDSFEMQVEKEYGSICDIALITFYIFGIYHFSWYIINKSRQFSYEDLLIKLKQTQYILMTINKTLDIYDEKSLKTMDTKELLEQTLCQFNDSDEESDDDKEDNSDGETDEETDESQQSSDEESIESSNGSDSESDENDESKNNIDKQVNSEKEAAEILTSMGKNWVYCN